MMPVAGEETAAAEQSGSESDRSDCSRCVRRPSAAGVRVSLDLSQFYADRRARVLMWAPRGRRVRWLARRVARALALPPDVALMSRGHLLPAAEPLLLLDPDIPVQVVDMSYVFTAHEGSNNISSQRLTTDPGITDARAMAIQYNEPGEQKSPGLSQTSSPRATLDDYRSDCEVHLVRGVDATMETSEGHSVEYGEELQRLKRRALQLLDEHEAAAPKRRRRRRRRPATVTPAPMPTALAPAALTPAAPAPTAHTPAAPAPAAPALDCGGVLRNGCGTRPPRLVRALSPSPLARVEL